MPATIDNLTTLYEDNRACARLIGLSYIEAEDAGLTRKRRGKGFVFVDADDRPVTDKKLRKCYEALVIPPAWRQVWICPDQNGHLLATGIDEKGRKQYIYHQRWRTMRDLIKFYRMIVFAQALPTIRRNIKEDLQRPQLDREKVIGVMLWLLDNTYLRIGNETYFTANNSVGLTTLSDKNLVIAGPVITLFFRGKSGKEQQITFEDKTVAAIIKELIEQRGERLFRYHEGASYASIESSDINAYLHEITGVHISAKDFRTWGGTLMAFNHLVEAQKGADKPPKPAKVVVEAVDAAANVLGNTRAVAKSSYVHPDILNIYTEKNFSEYYAAAQKKRARTGLDKRESELVDVLEQLFETEFSLLKK